jgi:uncharacterized membrane protein YfcA
LSVFDAAVALTGVAAGAVAAVAGFGVGSLLTPLLTSRYDAKLAVAIVAIPHAIATLLRLWRLRHDISWTVLRGFGVASAAGGLVGAIIFTRVAGSALQAILGVLLVAVGSVELLGRSWRIQPRWSVAAGALSGMFGGMVGSQGGVRSAGLLALNLPPRAFVATAAAIALIVDAVRIPFYMAESAAELRSTAREIAIATGGVVVGTFAGTAILLRLSPRLFRRAIGAVLVIMGLWLLR